jgi:hypothetical protein
MKHLLALAFVALLAAGALAQDNDNSLGMFFTSDIGLILSLDDPTNPPDEPMHPYTNLESGSAPGNGYIILLYPTVDTIGGYELGIEFDPPTPFVLSVTGPNGWTNFGSNTNHLVGYQTPVPVADGGVVFATVSLLASGPETVNINFLAANPPSIPGVPVIADGADPENLIACQLASAPQFWPTVATLNGEGVVAAETRSLSGIKALFD